MKILKAKDGYVYVQSNHSQVYGSTMYIPDTFDEKSIVEVTQATADTIRAEIEKNQPTM